MRFGEQFGGPPPALEQAGLVGGALSILLDIDVYDIESNSLLSPCPLQNPHQEHHSVESNVAHSLDLKSATNQLSKGLMLESKVEGSETAPQQP